MKRYFRIARIIVRGKYIYLKRYRRWVNGQLFRDLNRLFPYYYEEMVKKYGNDEYEGILKHITDNIQQLNQPNK